MPETASNILYYGKENIYNLLIFLQNTNFAIMTGSFRDRIRREMRTKNSSRQSDRDRKFRESVQRDIYTYRRHQPEPLHDGYHSETKREWDGRRERTVTPPRKESHLLKRLDTGGWTNLTMQDPTDIN